MRRSFTTSDAHGFAAHDHVVWCGAGSAPLDRLATQAFAEALARGERLVFVVDDPHPDCLSALGDPEDLIARDVLRLVNVRDTYAPGANTGAQRVVFASMVEEAIRDGHTGLCVVADNSSGASGTDAEFAEWLAWEAVADQLQSEMPINGVCYFDTDRVGANRLADLAVMHSVCSAEIGDPAFRLVFDRDVLRVRGEIDATGSVQLARLLDTVPALSHPTLDMGETSYIDHRTLLAFNAAALRHGRITVRHAPEVVRRLWEILAIPYPHLEFV